MANVAPFELMSGPVTLYVAAAATPIPEISVDPPTAWAVVGRNGNKNYAESGVVVTPPHTVEPKRTLGSTGPRKFFRTEEDLMIGLTLEDVTLETLAVALNNATINTVVPAAGTAGTRDIDLLRGFEVAQRAFLIRSDSPYGADFEGQYWVPRASVISTGALTYVKGDAVGMEVEISAIEDDTDGFGKLLMQDADPA